jgi:hypothetical protein
VRSEQAAVIDLAAQKAKEKKTDNTEIYIHDHLRKFGRKIYKVMRKYNITRNLCFSSLIIKT